MYIIVCSFIHHNGKTTSFQCHKIRLKSKMWHWNTNEIHRNNYTFIRAGLNKHKTYLNLLLVNTMMKTRKW